MVRSALEKIQIFSSRTEVQRADDQSLAPYW
jgi:hypothetical protein